MFSIRYFLAVSIISIMCIGGCITAATDLQDILVGYDVGFTSFLEKEYITRYDMTKYLSAATCTDCVVPDEEMIHTYTPQWLAQRQGEIRYNIDDVTGSMPYAGENYYYCLADTVENGLMYGYPKQTSPYCPGKFCGDSTARYTEVIESVYRLARDFIYDTYETSWSDIALWAEKNQSTIPVTRLAKIQEKEAVCGDEPCQLTSATELDIYLYYCSKDMSVCNLPIYRAFPAGTRPSGPFTALVKAGIIPPNDADTFTLHDFVDPSTFLLYLSSVYTLQGCTWNTDYDGDHRFNTKDNCPLTYNPHQYDEDNDSMGNTCDDDIDGDGLIHPVGIVDDANIINPRLWKESDDDALFVPIDALGLSGTREADDEEIMALEIRATPPIGAAPLSVAFSQEYVGTISSLTWDFGDGTIMQGLDPIHSYDIPGLYVVKATATLFGTRKIVAKLTVEVLPGEQTRIACAGEVDALIVEPGGEITLTHNYVGAVGKVVREVDNEIITVDPGNSAGYIFDTPGYYPIQMQCYTTAGEWAGLSQFLVYVGEEGYGAYIEASDIYIQAGETVGLETVYAGFVPEEIERIVRDFGDDTDIVDGELNTVKTYPTPGAYVVRETIIFKDKRDPLDASITIYVASPGAGRTTVLDGDPLIGDAGDVFSFQLTPINIPLEEYAHLVWECGDIGLVSRRTDTDAIADGLFHECIYATPGSKRVKAYLYTRDGEVYPSEMSIYVVGNTSCLDNPEQYQCDLDTDTLPDMCDDDIDGDGIPNCLSLLTSEQTSCDIDETNINATLLTNCYAAIRDGADFDNCPFIANTDQQDTDEDAYGDACDPAVENPTIPDASGNTGGGSDNSGNNEGEGSNPGDGDGGNAAGDDDGDGIPNERDACDGIPESGNGTQDGDGCPELPEYGEDNWSENPFIEAESCKVCPCPYADYASELWKGDRIRALLLDEGGEIIYRYTKPEIIDADIPDEMLGG